MMACRRTAALVALAVRRERRSARRGTDRERPRLVRILVRAVPRPRHRQQRRATLPGTDALRVKYRGALPALLTERTDMAPDLVKTYVRQGITVMPFFRKTEIDDTELEAIAAYLTRNNPRRDR